MRNLVFSIVFLFSIPSQICSQDTRADELAGNVMTAIGGVDAWENTRYLQWNFFGARKWWWDKQTGDVRVESQRNDMRVAMNVNEMTGNVFVHGAEQVEQDSLDKYLRIGYEAWINDSYWLVMPFKLKDPGTNLSHIGQRNSKDGKSAEVLELTFSEVGVTPENKYWIYVDPETNLITQWDFFTKAGDSKPRFSLPWTNYKKYGDIMLSDGRGDRGLSNLAVYDQLPFFLFHNVVKSADDLMVK